MSQPKIQSKFTGPRYDIWRFKRSTSPRPQGLMTWMRPHDNCNWSLGNTGSDMCPMSENKDSLPQRFHLDSPQDAAWIISQLQDNGLLRYNQVPKVAVIRNPVTWAERKKVPQRTDRPSGASKLLGYSHAKGPLPNLTSSQLELRSQTGFGRPPNLKPTPLPSTTPQSYKSTTTMPFFDIPKPFVKAFVARPRKSANNVADAVEGPSSRRRPSWAKLGRPKSKGPCAARNQNHDSATDGEGAREGAGTVDEELAHRACGVASSSGCLRDETSSEDEGEQEEEEDQEEGEGEDWGYAELDDDDELAQWWSGMQGHTERRRRRPWSALMDRFSAHEEGSGGSDSDETAVPTPAGSATPVENLSRSNSYKIATVLDVDRGSPLHPGLAIPAIAASLGEAAVDPHGLRIVPKTNTAARAARRYDEVMDLPSFRPLHPAIAFSDEGF